MEDKTIKICVDPEFEDLIPGFLENRRRDIKDITEALKCGDFQTAQTRGHIMKGAGGGYGFDAVTEIGRRIEEAAKAKDADRIAEVIRTLSDYLGRLNIIYG